MLCYRNTTELVIQPPLVFGDLCPPTASKIWYLGVLFMRVGKMQQEMNGRFMAVFLALHVPDRTVVVKKELSHSAKLSISWSLYVPALSCARELWAATEPDLRLVEENRWMDALLSNHPFLGLWGFSDMFLLFLIF